LTAKLALDEGTRREAYRIRYRSYEPHGYVPQAPDGVFMDPFDDANHSRTLVIYRDECPVATLRLSCSLAGTPASLLGSLPCADLFETELRAVQARLEAQGRRPVIAEVNRLAKMPEIQSDHLITVGLFKMLKYLAVASPAESFVVAVRLPHVKFYRRLGFETLAPVRRLERYNVSLALMGCERGNFAAIEVQAERALRSQNALSGPENPAEFLGGALVPVFHPPGIQRHPDAPALGFDPSQARPGGFAPWTPTKG
jgi:hypothetical protein